MGRGPEQTIFSPKDRWPTYTWKRCLTSLIVREIQIKSTTSPHTYHNDNKTTNRKCCRGFREKGPLCTADGIVNHYNHFGKQQGDYTRN